MKKLISLLLAFVMIFGMATNVAKADDDDIRLWVDGKYVSTDAKPYIEDSRTLVPIRFIAEALGYNVEWVESSQTVILTNGSDRIVMVIGSKNATKNGTTITLNKEPRLKGSRTFVPIRDVAERFGRNVDWDQNNWTVIVGTGYTAPARGNSDYGISDYGNSDYGNSNYGDSGYSNYGDSGYGDSGYSNYGDSGYGDSGYGDSDYN